MDGDEQRILLTIGCKLTLYITLSYQVWMIRDQRYPAMERTDTYEKGIYVFFDVENWEKVAEAFQLDFHKLENEPPLPSINPFEETETSQIIK